MRRPSRAGLLWMFVCCTSISLTAQNLESIGRENPLSVNGGISINQILYASKGLPSRRDPYSYFAGGNLTMSIYGWAIPFAFNVSNQSTSFSQPFNRYALHPTWKWATLHAGYTSMSFSPYTLNGHIFSGAAMELTPGKWKISALYGRFLKATPSDTSLSRHNTPTYQRMGYGIKTGYSSGGHSVELILFRAGDARSSIPDPPDSLLITPQENHVVSAAITTTIFKHFIFRSEVATSALTKDTRSAVSESGHWLAHTGKLFTSRLSSTYYQAMKASLDYQYKGSLVGIAYERIDPEYRTLGAYYFNNDLENVTVNSSAVLGNGKLNVAGSVGLQRDNVDKTRISTMRRVVTSLNLAYTPSEKLNIAGSWSTFQTYTNVRSAYETINQLTPYDQLDTLDFTQISRNASLTGMVLLPGDEARRQNLNFSLSWQDAADRQGSGARNAGMRFYQVSAGYSFAVAPRNITITMMFNTSINDNDLVKMRMIGPSASVTRSFLNRRLRTTLSGAWNQTYNQGAAASAVWNGRFNAAFAMRGRHNVTTSVVLVNRRVAEALSRSATELTATIGYQYSFGVRGRTRDLRKPEKNDP